MSASTFLLLFLSVIISGLSVLFVHVSSKNLKLILSFSGAYLFAVSVLHLIPEIYLQNPSSTIGIYILIGFFLQILLEFFTEGIEHGHIHIHKHEGHSHAFPYTMMIGLSIHSFLEGMPLSNQNIEAHRSLLTGIVFHNIPIAIALMTMLLNSEINRNKSVLFLVVFALITPLGTLTSDAIGANTIGNISVYFDKIMAVVIGIFLHISTTILFESSENHRFNLIKFLVILCGAGLALVSL
jgi:zinc and cadmium transporter